MPSSRRENLLLLAWTTVATRADADKLAIGAIELHLAACAQVEGPIHSFYRWNDKIENNDEYRLCFKVLPSKAVKLAAWVQNHHPYDTPEWIVVRGSVVGEKYLSWAKASGTA